MKKTKKKTTPFDPFRLILLVAFVAFVHWFVVVVVVDGDLTSTKQIGK